MRIVAYLIEYLGKFEFIFETILDYESGDQMGSFEAKQPPSNISCLGPFKRKTKYRLRGMLSKEPVRMTSSKRWPLPIRTSNYCALVYIIWRRHFTFLSVIYIVSFVDKEVDGVDNGGEVYTCIIVYTQYVCIDIRYDNLQMAGVFKVGKEEEAAIWGWDFSAWATSWSDSAAPRSNWRPGPVQRTEDLENHGTYVRGFVQTVNISFGDGSMDLQSSCCVVKAFTE